MANIYNKTDMIYNDYSWTTVKGDDPKISGEPDSTLFSRKEGYEVLYMVNKCITKWDFKLVGSGQKIERLIRTLLPADVRSQNNVYNWLHTNYSKH